MTAGFADGMHSVNCRTLQAGSLRSPKSSGRVELVAGDPSQLKKADQSFLRLQDELAGTENRIATSRNDYNEAVRAYNTYIRTFPQALTAKVTGAKPRTYFEAAAGTETAPTVNFGTTPAPASTSPAAPKTP